MEKSPAANAPSEAISTEQLAHRYDALIRLAKLIQSQAGEKDLFQTFASELDPVVPFDGLSQFDPAANRVQWHFLEPYDKKFESVAVRAIPKEDTVAWWVYRNQQPVVIQSVDQEIRFPLVMDRLSQLGIHSACAFPLSTAHRQLGSMVFGSHIENAYSLEDQQFLSVVVNQIAVAMDDARAQQQLRLPLDITNRVITKLELPELLQEISAGIRQTMQCDVIGVVVSEPGSGQLRRYTVDFPGNEDIVEGRISESVKQVFRTGRAFSYSKEEIAADPILAGMTTTLLSSARLRIRSPSLLEMPSRISRFQNSRISWRGKRSISNRRYAANFTLRISSAMARHCGAFSRRLRPSRPPTPRCSSMGRRARERS